MLLAHCRLPLPVMIGNDGTLTFDPEQQVCSIFAGDWELMTM